LNTKTCSTCGLSLPLTEFYKHSSGGTQGSCKKCYKARAEKWRSTPQGQESQKQGKRKYYLSEHGRKKKTEYESTKEYKERKKEYDHSPERKAYHKEYNKSDAGKKRLRRYTQTEKGKARQRRANTSEKGIQSRRRHQKSEKYKERTTRYKESGQRTGTLRKYTQSPKGRENLNRGKYKRRGLLSKTENTLTARQWQEILEEYGRACVYCGATDVKLTKDHVVPLSKGGKNVKENVVPACRSCNAKKHNKIIT